MREDLGESKLLRGMMPCCWSSSMSSATCADTSLVSSCDVPACSHGVCRRNQPTSLVYLLALSCQILHRRFNGAPKGSCWRLSVQSESPLPIKKAGVELGSSAYALSSSLSELSTVCHLRCYGDLTPCGDRTACTLHLTYIRQAVAKL